MSPLTRSFRLTVPPEVVIATITRKLPDRYAFHAPLRLHRVSSRGFHVLAGTDESRPKFEMTPGLRVRLAPEAGGTRVDIAHAGTVLAGGGVPQFVAFPLFVTWWTISSVVDRDWPGLVIALVGWALIGAFARTFLRHHRRRDAAFAELADSLEALLGPLMTSEDLARSLQARGVLLRAAG